MFALNISHSNSVLLTATLCQKLHPVIGKGDNCTEVLKEALILSFTIDK